MLLKDPFHESFFLCLFLEKYGLVTKRTRTYDELINQLNHLSFDIQSSSLPLIFISIIFLYSIDT
jgi:hypothetical protein